MPSYSAILVCALTLVSAGSLRAQQVTKPPSTAGATDRLPRPTGVNAAQQPDGRIRVAWKPVEGAARYKLIRSVPPEPSKAVTLPNPSDTQYVDADVKTGSTYYYVVSAVNEGGIEGLRTGTAPITAAAVAAPGDTSPAPAAVPPPANAAVSMYDYLRPKVTWTTTLPEARFVIERRDSAAGSLAGGSWEPAVTLSDKSWPCTPTCTFIEDPRPLSRNTTSQYRITTVEPAPSTRRSEPVTTNTIPVVVIRTAPPEVHDVSLVKGEGAQLPFRPAGTGLQYFSQDSNLVSIWSPGVVKAKEVSSVYIWAVGHDENGAIKLWVWRATVSDKPQ